MPQGNVWVTEGLYPNSPYHFKSQSHPSAAASSAGARDGADRDARHDADSLHGGGAGRVWLMPATLSRLCPPPSFTWRFWMTRGMNRRCSRLSWCLFSAKVRQTNLHLWTLLWSPSTPDLGMSETASGHLGPLPRDTEPLTGGSGARKQPQPKALVRPGLLQLGYCQGIGWLLLVVEKLTTLRKNMGRFSGCWSPGQRFEIWTVTVHLNDYFQSTSKACSTF